MPLISIGAINDVSLHNSTGTAPDNLLSAKFKTCRVDDSCPKASGIVPVNLLLLISIRCILESLLISGGIVPVNSLPPSRSSFKIRSLSYDGGIVPRKLLPSNSTDTILVASLKEEGNAPKKEFVESLKAFKLRRPPILVGIDPIKPL